MVLKIDILAMELANRLPNWLSRRADMTRTRDKHRGRFLDRLKLRRQQQRQQPQRQPTDNENQ